MNSNVLFLTLLLVVCISYFLSTKISQYLLIIEIKKIGFRLSSLPQKHLKNKLKLLSSQYMQDPIMPFGQLATHNGLYVAWCASYSHRNSKLVIWSYRKAESDTYDPKEIWWQAIHVKGMAQNQLQQLGIKYQFDFKTDDSINEKENSIVIFKRPLIGFSKVFFLIRDVVQILKEQK